MIGWSEPKPQLDTRLRVRPQERWIPDTNENEVEFPGASDRFFEFSYFLLFFTSLQIWGKHIFQVATIGRYGLLSAKKSSQKRLVESSISHTVIFEKFVLSFTCLRKT